MKTANNSVTPANNAVTSTFVEAGMGTDVNWELISPTRATAMLNTMGANRKVFQAHVDRLARTMKNGLWVQEAADPIRFNYKGELIDGQHRLRAIVASDMTLSMVVVRGLPESSMAVLDTGKQRSLKDFLEIRGEKYARHLSAAINSLHAYWTSGELVSQQWGVQPLSPREAIQLLEENPGLRESVLPADRVAKIVRGGVGRWTAIHYILTSIDADDANAFFEKLYSGQNISANDPVGLLRNRLLLDISALKRIGAREYSALVFKAWNFYRRGQEIKVLSWRGGGAHPENYPVPM